jgi:hypothetical protein
MTMKKTRAKHPWELSPAELDKLVEGLDGEFVADQSRPLTPAERRLWERAKRRKPGRPVEGQGAQVISVSIEKGLLKKSDQLAKKKRISRAKLIARGLRAVLAAEGLA